jgi:hypothetical protein
MIPYSKQHQLTLERHIVIYRNDIVAVKPTLKDTTELFASRNYDLESGDWEDSIIWDDNKPYKPFSHISLNMNDVNVLFDLTSMDNKAMGDGFRGMIPPWFKLQNRKE